MAQLGTHSVPAHTKKPSNRPGFRQSIALHSAPNHIYGLSICHHAPYNIILEHDIFHFPQRPIRVIRLGYRTLEVMRNIWCMFTYTLNGFINRLIARYPGRNGAILQENDCLRE
jgi:hypothetical protein